MISYFGNGQSKTSRTNKVGKYDYEQKTSTRYSKTFYSSVIFSFVSRDLATMAAGDLQILSMRTLVASDLFFCLPELPTRVGHFGNRGCLFVFYH